jgi:glycerol-3-phosphate acyltransferase PlsY
METSTISIVLLLLGAYLIGSLNAAKILTNVLKKGPDISTLGTKNAGGWNAWMNIGKIEGFSVLLFDALKGAAVVFGSRSFGFNELAVFGSGIAVIAGHDWPIFFRFQGGKGFATLIGMTLAFSPASFPIAGGAALILTLLRLSGLAPFALLGLTVFLEYQKPDLETIFILEGLLLAFIFAVKKLQAEWSAVIQSQSKFLAVLSIIFWDRVEKAPSLFSILRRKNKNSA